MASADKTTLPNFVPLHTGILEHLQAGRMSVETFGIYTLLLLIADYKTGICMTNSASIAFHFGALSGSGRRSTENYRRAIREHLEHLRTHKFINYASHPGSTAPYPILVHKYHVRMGRDSWKILDAFAPGSLHDPVYVESAADLSTECSKTVPSPCHPRGTSVESPWNNRGIPVVSPGHPRDTSVTPPGDGLLYKVVEDRYQNTDNRREKIDRDAADAADQNNSEGSPGVAFGDSPEVSPEGVSEDSPEYASEDVPEDASEDDASGDESSPEEETEILSSWEEAAQFLAKHIYLLAGRRPTQQMIESGGEKLLDIVMSEPQERFNGILLRARYALVESETAGYVKRNRQTGEEYTLYDVMHASKDPVATFAKHYEWIVEEAFKWAEDLERKKKQENPRAGRLMTFPDAITGEEE